jgi:hypothetical protein
MLYGRLGRVGRVGIAREKKDRQSVREDGDGLLTGQLAG